MRPPTAQAPRRRQGLRAVPYRASSAKSPGVVLRPPTAQARPPRRGQRWACCLAAMRCRRAASRSAAGGPTAGLSRMSPRRRCTCCWSRVEHSRRCSAAAELRRAIVGSCTVGTGGGSTGEAVSGLGGTATWRRAGGAVASRLVTVQVVPSAFVTQTSWLLAAHVTHPSWAAAWRSTCCAAWMPLAAAVRSGDSCATLGKAVVDLVGTPLWRRNQPADLSRLPMAAGALCAASS